MFFFASYHFCIQKGEQIRLVTNLVPLNASFLASIFLNTMIKGIHLNLHVLLATWLKKKATEKHN
jgi:hypothetical protein